MRVRVLGPIEVRGGPGQPWARPTPQQRLVLGALAAPVGRARDLAVLAEALWGGDPPDNAHRLVQALVSRLRAALGQAPDAEGPLASVEGGWRLDLSADDLDATRFDARVDEAGALLDRGEVDRAGTVVDEALAAWRGHAFGDLADEPVVVAEAMRLEERRLDALQVRVRTRLAAGAHGQVIGQVIAELKDLLAEHPLREQLWGLLMVALYRAGRQAEALVTYQRVRERLVDELGVEPGPDLQRLHAAILRHDLDDHPWAGSDRHGATVRTIGRTPKDGSATARGRPVGTPSVRGLPTSRTSFVGRRHERRRLADLLRANQVVTVVGPGGVGKTRLSTAVAADVAPTFTRGGAFVDLAGVEPNRLPRALATAMGVGEAPDDAVVDTVVAHVRRGPLLLLVDNCEHLLPVVGGLVEQLVGASRDLTVLATSRERLGVDGEQVYLLEPLSVEVDVDDGRSQPDATRLFLDRTRAVAPDFRPDPARVAELCRRLDGLPLAIELAAARAGSLGLDGLLTGLDDRLLLLRATGGPSRHRSLRAVLDWSHDLLDDDEQATLRRLAVFTGAFDLAAATAVVDHRPDVTLGRSAASRTADLVGRLVDKSLVVHHDEAGLSRWTLLDTVREYALEHLDASAEAAEVRRRHLRWAVAAAQDLRDRMSAGETWREPFRAVEGDLRVALAAGPVRAFAGTPDKQSDGDSDGASNGAPVARDDVADRLDLAFAVATLQARTASYEAALDAYETAIGLARSVAGPAELARAALGASVSGMVFGVSDRTRVDWLEEALAAQGASPTPLRARLLARLSMELYWSADRARSLALAEEALAAARAVGDDAVQAQALYARHYTSRGPAGAEQRLEVSAEVVERAERGGATELALAGRAAHVVDLLSVGDLTGMDAAVGVLWEAADRLQRPAFQWYTDVYLVVRALLEGRFVDADARATTAIAAGRNVPEFTVGLYFAEAITDLRDPASSVRRQRADRLADLARRFPGVLVWRCLGLLNELALLYPGPRTVVSTPLPSARHEGVDLIRSAARSLADEVLDPSPRDAHWLVEACLLTELAAELGDAHLAARLDEALRPHAGRLAVAGRVGACRGAVSHALGLARWTLEDLDGASDDLDDAVAQHERIGARPHLARSLSALGRVLELRGTPGDQVAARSARARAATVGEELRLDVSASSGR